MFLEDSIREFKKKMKIGQFKEVDPEEAKRIEEEKKKKEEQDERLAAEIKVGTRYVYHFRSCLISSQSPKKRLVFSILLTTTHPPKTWYMTWEYSLIVNHFF